MCLQWVLIRGWNKFSTRCTIKRVRKCLIRNYRFVHTRTTAHVTLGCDVSATSIFNNFQPLLPPQRWHRIRLIDVSHCVQCRWIESGAHHRRDKRDVKLGRLFRHLLKFQFEWIHSRELPVGNIVHFYYEMLAIIMLSFEIRGFIQHKIKINSFTWLNNRIKSCFHTKSVSKSRKTTIIKYTQWINVKRVAYNI